MSVVVEKQSWKALHNYKSRYAPDVTHPLWLFLVYIW